MKLVGVQVQKFRNILDSTTVPIEDGVTCLVGKNESGKTAFLHALYRLNPARPNAPLSVPDQYPAWLEKQDRLRGVKLEEITPVTAAFKLDADERKAIAEKFGEGTLQSDTISVSRTYAGKQVFDFESDERKAVQHVTAVAKIGGAVGKEVRKAETFAALDELTASFNGREGADAKSAAAALAKAKTAVLGGEDLDDALIAELSKGLPRFFYFADYTRLPGKVQIAQLLQADPKTLSDNELTARALLQLAASEKDYLLNPDYERRKRELENVANALTQQVLSYWTQNPELRVNIDITKETQTNAQGQPVAVLDELHVRMWDERHLLSLPFSERSTGFQWFFSFLAAFSEFEYRQDPVIILLDEPALGLHARAQKDFLRFIDERLVPKHQVIYTTHSPFMVEPGKLERVRLVEDRGRAEGSRVTKEVLSTDPDTLFPLQGALGYDMAQHLFIAPHNLVLEGTSDFTYLTLLSGFLEQQGRAHLDGRWSVVPVGGADLIPTFVALLGHHLSVTVLIDSRKEGHQRLSNLAGQGLLPAKSLLTIGDVLGRKLADIEDVFTVEDYLLLYNRSFGKKVKPDDLKGTDPLVSRIARHEGVDRFDHGRPADTLLRHRDELLPKLSSDTLDRFEKLFQRIDATLPV